VFCTEATESGVGIRGGYYINTTAILNDGVWHHVAMFSQTAARTSMKSSFILTRCAAVTASAANGYDNGIQDVMIGVCYDTGMLTVLTADR
jgi:hypothetical protein